MWKVSNWFQSLSLGSSHCIQCSNKWPVICAILIVVFLLAGIALVTILLVLNLTVAVGTLNGIIFYAQSSMQIPALSFHLKQQTCSYHGLI